MQVFFSIIGVLIWSRFTLLDTAFATDADLSTALPFHLLQRVATRSYQKSEEIDLWKLFDGNIHLVRRTLRTLLLMVLDRRAEIGIIFHGTIHETDALIFKLLAITDFSSVRATSMAIVSRGRRRRPDLELSMGDNNNEKSLTVLAQEE